MSAPYAITNKYKYLHSTNLQDARMLRIQPEWAVYLRSTPGERYEGHCKEQCHWRCCQFTESLCTVKNHKTQEKGFRSVDLLNFKSKCESISSPSFLPVLLPNLLMLCGYFSFKTQWSNKRMNVKSNTLFSLLICIIKVPYRWELSLKWTPFVLLFTGTLDPAGMRIMCKLRGNMI